MFYAEMIARLIRRCGREIISPAGIFSAYLNPLRGLSDPLLPTAAGVFDPGRWLLLAGAEEAKKLDSGMILTAGTQKFLLERAEPVFWQGSPVYLWGIAAKVQEGAGGSE